MLKSNFTTELFRFWRRAPYKRFLQFWELEIHQNLDSFEKVSLDIGDWIKSIVYT